MPKYDCLIVEGPHDAEFVARLLRPYDFHRIQQVSRLDAYWSRLVPPTFPHKGDLLARVPVPLFLENCAKTHSIAIHVAIGDTRLVKRVEEDLNLVNAAVLHGLGVILDADAAVPPQGRFGIIKSGLEQFGLDVPAQPGVVSNGKTRCGVFVLPDNQIQGTLENILLDCARCNYPRLLPRAEQYVDGVDTTDPALTSDPKVELSARAGRDKAVVGCIANILKPGRSVQVSIQDNLWLEGQAFTLPLVVRVQQFLTTLMEIP